MLPEKRRWIIHWRHSGTRFGPGYFVKVAAADGWKERLIERHLAKAIRVKFLEPNDAAVSKYARGEPKDRAWIREGLSASILSGTTIEYRFRTTPFLDQAEDDRAKRALAEDLDWLRGKRRKKGRAG